MVAILVLLTFAACVLVGLVVAQRLRVKAEGPSTDAALHPVPAGAPAPAPRPAYFLHPGHVWVRLTADGLASIGVSEFAANFVGALARVEVPKEGTRLRQGEPAWTLVSGRNRRLTQAMPVDGEVVAVNRALVGDQGAVRDPSHRAEWILKIRPSRLGESLQSLFGGALAETWGEVAGLRLNAALSPALGRLANDGGVWVANFGDLLDDAAWVSLRQDLFPSPKGGEAAEAASRN